MMIRITRDTVIYILCPGNIETAGPEALHQLRYYLDKCGYRACLSYYDGGSTTSPKYLKYNPVLVPLETIEDHSQHVLIVPENATFLLKNYRNINRCIWWLSLQFYDGGQITIPSGVIEHVKKAAAGWIPFLYKWSRSIKKMIPGREVIYPYYIRKNDFHLCGSRFAYEFVRSRYGNVKMFVEPLGLDYLGLDAPDLSSRHRGDTLPYNPSKPSEIMSKLLRRTDLQFVPIRGLKAPEIIELFRRSKLYVDFGFFGGPERLPKESVANGTMLLVGRRNAAKNNFDVAIPGQYKIKAWNNEQLVVDKIKYMLEHYDDLIHEFDPFRSKISELERNFVRSIEEVFVWEK
ncbi:MAG: hypothetical protein LBH19_11285 [Dysgonamonadaceae bacterium]|jgi:hypothetical protein|nr:hypothetical protein [Dysgonamonadaceae bacterium]